MGSVNCVKYLMFVFNFLFFLMGCGILGLGIWLKVEKGDYEDIIPEYSFITAANIAIAAGAVILIVAFLGCCGSIKEIPSMLLAFFVLMLIIFILEISGGGFAYAKRGKIDDELRDDLIKAIKSEYYKNEDTDAGIYKAINEFQINFKCCGYDNFTDWKDSVYNTKTNGLPTSCCRDQSDAKCDGKTFVASFYNLKGCYGELKEFLKDNLLYIGGSLIAFAMIQIIGMVFAMYLYCQFRDGNGTLA